MLSTPNLNWQKLTYLTSYLWSGQLTWPATYGQLTWLATWLWSADLTICLWSGQLTWLLTVTSLWPDYWLWSHSDRRNFYLHAVMTDYHCHCSLTLIYHSSNPLDNWITDTTKRHYNQMKIENIESILHFVKVGLYHHWQGSFASAWVVSNLNYLTIWTILQYLYSARALFNWPPLLRNLRMDHFCYPGAHLQQFFMIRTHANECYNCEH